MRRVLRPEWVRRGVVGEASDGLARTFVDRIGACRQLAIADPADAGVPQAHALLIELPLVVHARDRNSESRPNAEELKFG